MATEAKKTLERIMQYPEASPKLSKRTRRCRTNGFPYVVIYQVKYPAYCGNHAHEQKPGNVEVTTQREAIMSGITIGCSHLTVNAAPAEPCVILIEK